MRRNWLQQVLVIGIVLACCHCSGSEISTEVDEETASDDTQDNEESTETAVETNTEIDDGETDGSGGSVETSTPSDSQAPANRVSSGFVNGGDEFTTDNTVLLTLAATDNESLAAYYPSEAAATPTANASGWILLPVSTTYTGEVVYNIQGGIGRKTITVWFKDGAGNISSSASDAINYVDPELKEVSYYPSDYAWEEMWTQWPSAKVDMAEDLDVLSDLGVNTVRIFVMPTTFGYPTPSETYLTYLDEAIALIAAHEMRVHITLFDCWYSHADVTGSLVWLNAVMEDRQDDDRIAVWELQNEMNLGDATVRTWLSQVFPAMKSLAGEAYATVSVTETNYLDDIAALTAPNSPDLYSLHWYPDGDFQWTNFLEDELDDALSLIGNAELLIGEFGYPVYRYSETSQAKLYQDMIYTAQVLDISHLGFWTFNDFPAGTGQCGGTVPSDVKQFYYGVRDTALNERDAADVIAEAWVGDGIDQAAEPGPENASFESINPVSYAHNWITWDQNWTGTRRYSQDCTRARTGNCSARIDSLANVSVGFYAVPALKIDPAHRYSVSAYAQTRNLSGSVQVTISWYSWNGTAETWVGNSSSSVLSTNTLNQWTSLGVTGVAPPANADLALIFLMVTSTTTGAEVWIDDVTFQEQ